MFALLLPLVLGCHAAPPVDRTASFAESTPARSGDDKALKALDAWLKLYHSGKMDLRARNIAGDSIAVKYGITPKNGLGVPTWLGDLEAILEAVARIDDADAARSLLEVVSVGLDPTGRYTLEMAPYEVRAAGERWAAKLVSAPAKETLAKAARGELKVEKARMAAMQTAAVKCLGLIKDRAFRPVLEQALSSGDELVRNTAAEALGTLGDEAAAGPLVALLDRDTVDSVLVAATRSLHALFWKYLPKPGSEPAVPAATADLPEGARLAVRSASQALGRTTWRADMVLIRLFDDFRSLEAVPALIAQLERFRAHPEEIKSGKLSGLVVYQAHELLVSMTGAVFPADQPEKWRAFWGAEKDRIVIGNRKPAAAAPPIGNNLCGIPVQGTRVAFLLDLSGPMDWPMTDESADGINRKMTRLDHAKLELTRAIDGLPPNAWFNLITFNGNPKCESWKPTLVPATKPNREACKKYVDGLRALGGANLWSGLEEALKIKSLVYGNRSSDIDELFLLSNGTPTVGDVQDPIEMLRLVQECNRFASARISTVHFDSEVPQEIRNRGPRMSITPQELMRRMAQENGGRFREL
ncbi:MAG: HEAT repeat domain-containing protein [Planctomycetota bacterium]